MAKFTGRAVESEKPPVLNSDKIEESSEAANVSGSNGVLSGHEGQRATEQEGGDGEERSRDQERSTPPPDTSNSLAPPQAAFEDVPRKMLRLNANGTFGSPPSKKELSEGPTASHTETPTKRKRGRPKRSLVVTFKYGASSKLGTSFGSHAHDILTGLTRWQSAIQKPALHPKPAPSTQPPADLKPTHPFFLGKPPSTELVPEKQDPGTAASSRTSPRKSAVTPGKLRAQARAHQLREHDEHRRIPALDLRPSTKYPRQAGSGTDAPWPSRELVHVRGPPDKIEPVRSTVTPTTGLIERKKGKHLHTVVQPRESLVHHVAENLRVAASRARDSLRTPRRLLTSGEVIQANVRAELRSDFGNLGTTRCSALPKLYTSIRDSLTPFDRGVREHQAWTHKYAPQTSSDVLHVGKEVEILRHWVRRSTVDSLDSGINHPSKPISTSRPPKKRKRRGSDLDGFIVSGDEDLGSFDELSDPDESSTTIRKARSIVRTVRGDSRAKMANVILLSGPHGCGKTASVYAVAKELGFEVFEINAGSRRSGRDILERVGDMAENHLIQQQVAKELLLKSDTEVSDSEIRPDNVNREVASGRQATMSAFMQSMGKPKPITKSKPKLVAATNMLKPKPKKAGNPKQKQSLILFEEVDVLVEEEQGFGATVRDLALHSKRPIILTCNDEKRVQIEEDMLHGILRFSPPPLDLAVDYLLLMAGHEGHLLDRDSVRTLYESKNHDLRATIANMDFWCQMSVGDRKGGLEWIYQRWPPGADVDEEGRTLRVASQNTYLTGMGWYSHDILVEGDLTSSGMAEELIHEIRDWWGVSTESWHSAPRIVCPAGHPSQSPKGNSSSLRRESALDEIDRALDALSSADIFCCYAPRLEPENQHFELLDPTIPPQTTGTREDFVEGYPLLQTDKLLDFRNTSARLACQIELLTARASNVSSCAPPLLGDIALQNHILSSLRMPSQQAPTTFTSIITAMEPLSETPASLPGASNFTMTSIDRPLPIVVAEIAPYVRSIAAYDLRLEEQRLRLSGLLSVNGAAEGRKVRKTRAARSALEGGRREATRRERWFSGPSQLNLRQVLSTAGQDWREIGEVAVLDGESVSGTAPGSTQGSTMADDEDAVMTVEQ